MLSSVVDWKFMVNVKGYSMLRHLFEISLPLCSYILRLLNPAALHEIFDIAWRCHKYEYSIPGTTYRVHGQRKRQWNCSSSSEVASSWCSYLLLPSCTTLQTH